MKKSLKTLVFTTMAAGMLAGCAPAAAANWSKEDLELMKDKLFGVVLPYLNEKGLTVSYNAEDEELTIRGGSVSEGELAKYAAKFTEKDGWKDVHAEYEGYEYVFRQRLEVPEIGLRFLDVSLEEEVVVPDNQQSQGAATGGEQEPEQQELQFCVTAWVPFYYSGADAAGWLNDCLTYFEVSEEDTVPALPAAPYYDVFFNYDEDDYIESFEVVAYEAESDPSSAYATVLGTAGFVSLGTFDGYASFDSDNSEFTVGCLYDATKKEFSVIASPSFGFPVKSVNAYLAQKFAAEIQASGNDLDEFPRWNGYLAQSDFLGVYNGLSEYNQYQIAFSSTTGLFAASNELGSLLLNSGFTKGVVSYGYQSYVSASEQYEVLPWLTVDNGTYYLIIEFEEITVPSTEWPTSKIATELVKLGIESEFDVPEFTGEFSNIQVSVSGNSLYIIIATTVATAQADYLAALGENFISRGTDPYGYDQYVSADYGYALKFMATTDGDDAVDGLRIIVSAPFGEFPSDYLVEEFELTDEEDIEYLIPSVELDGAKWFADTINWSNATEVIVETYFEDADAFAAGQAAVEAGLTAAGYQYYSSYGVWYKAAGLQISISADELNPLGLIVDILLFADEE